MRAFCPAICFLLLLLPLKTSVAQTGIGAFAGGGYISGDSPDIGSFTSSLFFDLDIGMSSYFYPRFSFIYAGEFGNLLPDAKKDYFPVIKGFSVKGIITQDNEDKFFFEEGFGFVYLNDRTFSFTDSWNLGVAFSLTAGIDLTDFYRRGFRIGLGTEYAFAFGGTFPKYFSLHLQGKYVF